MATFRNCVLSILFTSCQAGCSEPTWHAKFNWKAEEYFDDPQVIALCKAIEANDLPEIDRLVAAGADVKALGKDNMTPLLWAYPDDKPERLKKLLEHGADPNVLFQSDFNTRKAISAGDSVTHMASRTRFAKYFEYVFEHGGDPNLVCRGRLRFMNTPVFEVITGSGLNKKERVQLLIKRGPT